MQKKESKILTEAALVAELQRRGYDNTSVRTIQDWRRRELLPEFDRKGPGLGRGAGRVPSVWTDGEAIVERAVWVSDLIRDFGRENAYLQLWIMGYAVPLKQVKKALRQPVSDINQAIQKELKLKMKDGLVFEDVIDDALHEASRKFEKHSPPGFQVSLDRMSAAYNILFNPEYEPEDGAFEEFPPCEDVSGGQALPLDEDPMAGIFQYAAFIKEHLSFERMKEALRHCTDEDLRTVERDLGIMREIVFHFGRMVKAMFSAAPAEMTEGFCDRWHALFTVGRMFVLADLSLRRSGFGDWIDAVLPDVLHRVQAECSESREAEFSAASTQFVAASQAAADKLMQEWMANAKQKPTRRGRPSKVTASEMAT
jgi:hypothetical protein